MDVKQLTPTSVQLPEAERQGNRPFFNSLKRSQGRWAWLEERLAPWAGRTCFTCRILDPQTPIRCSRFTSPSRRQSHRVDRDSGTLALRFPDQGVIQIPLAKSRQQLGELIRNTADGDKVRLQQSRAVLQSAIEQFEDYVNFSQSNATNQQTGHFNMVTLSRLYASLADTLTKLDLLKDARDALAKSKQIGKPNRRPR